MAQVKHTESFMEILAKQLSDTQSKIHALIKSSLFQTSCLIPDVEEKIVKNLRWGLFSKDALWSLNGAELYKLHQYLLDKTSIGLFSPKSLKVLKDKEWSVHYDAEEMQSNVEVQKIQNKDSTTSFEDLLQKMNIQLCLPDYKVIFQEFISEESEMDNLWVYDYVDEYEEFKENFAIKSLTQVGGYGNFIQTEYDNSYIGQLNLDIGDAGSIYMYVCVDNQISTNIDMH